MQDLRIIKYTRQATSRTIASKQVNAEIARAITATGARESRKVAALGDIIANPSLLPGHPSLQDN